MAAAAVGRLFGRVAVVTGAGGGIGRAAARLFAREGASVVAVDLNEDEALRTAELIEKSGGCAIATKADVSRQVDCRNMVQLAEREYGYVDCLFNNAGIMMNDDGDASSITEAVWDKTFAVNVKGVWWGCMYGIEAMRRSGRPSAIVNTASFVARLGAATPQLAYTSSKGAVLAMTRELAVIHAREGIRVNALCPGPVRTPLLMDFLDTPEKKQRRLVHVPTGRFGEAFEMAQAALFLMSNEASFVTGVEFLVDGGLTASYVTPDQEPQRAPPSPFDDE